MNKLNVKALIADLEQFDQAVERTLDKIGVKYKPITVNHCLLGESPQKILFGCCFCIHVKCLPSL